MEQIQQLLGHSSVSTTEKYVILSKEFVVNIDNRSNTTHDVFAELE